MKKRLSNLELLRIVSIILIIIFHCVFEAQYIFEPHLSLNKLMIKTFYMFGELGVNCFILITGYFMVNGKFKTKKVIMLCAQTLFYSVISTMVACYLNIYEIQTLKQFLEIIFPIIFTRYWFVTVYTVIYILSPYINKFIHSLNKEEYKKLLLLLLMMYCIIPTFLGAVNNNTEGLLYYNRLIWLIIIYMIGGYIKLYGTPITKDKKISTKVAVAMFTILVLSILCIEKFDPFFAEIGITEVAYLWRPNNIIMLLLSVSFFGIFLNLDIKENSIINKVSSTTLGIYLVHDGILTNWIWQDIFNTRELQYNPDLIITILRATIIIFVVGMIIDLIRQKIEEKTLKKILDSERYERMQKKFIYRINKILKIDN